jgi:hypothetical protein
VTGVCHVFLSDLTGKYPEVVKGALSKISELAFLRGYVKIPHQKQPHPCPQPMAKKLILPLPETSQTKIIHGVVEREIFK